MAKKIYKSSITGEIVTKAFAKANPDTTFETQTYTEPNPTGTPVITSAPYNAPAVIDENTAYESPIETPVETPLNEVGVAVPDAEFVTFQEMPFETVSESAPQEGPKVETHLNEAIEPADNFNDELFQDTSSIQGDNPQVSTEGVVSPETHLNEAGVAVTDFIDSPVDTSFDANIASEVAPHFVEQTAAVSVPIDPLEPPKVTIPVPVPEPAHYEPENWSPVVGEKFLLGNDLASVDEHGVVRIHTVVNGCQSDRVVDADLFGACWIDPDEAFRKLSS